MSAQQKKSTEPSSNSVYILTKVPAEKVAQVIDDFLSEGPATIRKELEADGTYTIRVRRREHE